MKLNFHYFRRCFILFSSIFLFTLNYACSGDDNVIAPPKEQEESQQINPEDKLPLFTITTSEDIVDEPKIDAQMIISIADEVSYSGSIGIEIRGSSSQMFPKKSYGMETWDENGEDLSVELLGFPEEEDWVLYAPYSDRSMMRNKLIYDLSNDIGQYASRTKFVELVVNDENLGVYVFMEKLKRDSNRIDINKLKDDENSGEDVTGGYILKIDKLSLGDFGIQGVYNELNSFVSAYDPPNVNMGQEINFLYEYPKADKITVAQKAYISNYVAEFEDALASVNFADATIGYAAYIDVPSFIDFFLLNEVSNNVDGYRLSTYVTKEKNEKLKMGPIWDFNIAFGNANYCDNERTDIWAYKFNERCPEDFWQIPFWWNRLMQDPAFVLQVKERWGVLRSGAFANASVLAKIQGYRNTLDKAGAIDSNFSTWPIFGEYIWPNPFVADNYDEEMEYLTKWVDDRLNWLDGSIEAL